MSTFLSLPSATDIAQPPAPEAPILNDGFFPDIDPARLREEARIPPASPGRACVPRSWARS
jgi:hypothetical protein